MANSISVVRRLLIGNPFPTRADIHERLDKTRALAIFASDPISSNAYATEAIMSVLALMGSGALSLTMPIALVIGLLVLLVIFSYIQTILHYPDGGGAYTVTKDNLGTIPSLLAAAALLTDYVLTVSVSVSAGIRAITSAVPNWHEHRVLLALLAIAILTWINLRGVRESGTIFAVPTYAFVVGVLVIVVLGILRLNGLLGGIPAPPEPHALPPAGTVTNFLFIWLLLRAFAAGCTALTGIEAISNGVQAFKPPESKNAAETMVVMGVVAMSLFMGITYVSTQLKLLPEEAESILSQMARAVTGGGFGYLWVQISTMLILILAANTGYQDFPRLSSFLAKDGYMPRWMQNRGDRLVYNGGILSLAVISSIIVVIFQADEIAMLPLYALGVMLCFSLSQFGMVRLMGKVGQLKPGQTFFTGITTIHYEKRWHWKWLVNFIGGLTTTLVLIILIITKFSEGAWVIVVMIPILYWMFVQIKAHYTDVAEALSTRNMTHEQIAEIADVVIVPIGDVHRGTLLAIQYAQKISEDVRAVCVTTSEVAKERIETRWSRFPEITDYAKLVCLDYEYRDVLTPLVDYISQVNKQEFSKQMITVVIPEFMPETFMGRLLHNQTANFLRFRLQSQKDIVVIDVPYHIAGNGKAPLATPPVTEITEDDEPNKLTSETEPTNGQ